MLELLREFLEYNFGFLSGIFERIDQILAFWTFLAIGFVCGGFLIATMILGEVSELLGDFFGDHDFGHDFDHDAGADHDLSHDGHAGEHGGDHGSHDTAGITTPSIFSFRIILSFFSGFGIAGAIAMQLGNSVILSSLYGVGTGVIMAVLTYGFVMFLASNQASVNIGNADIVGREARVIVEIPQNGLGQIQIDTGVGTLTKLSKSADNSLIPEHSIVKVESISGETALVKKAL